VVAYLGAENAYTSAVMADTEGLQKELVAEMRGRIQEADVGVATRWVGGWVVEGRMGWGQEAGRGGEGRRARGRGRGQTEVIQWNCQDNKWGWFITALFSSAAAPAVSNHTAFWLLLPPPTHWMRTICSCTARTTSAPTSRYAGYYYYSRTEEGQQYKVHCRRKVPPGAAPPSEADAPDPAQPEEVILEENLRKKEGKFDFYMVGGWAWALLFRLLLFRLFRLPGDCCSGCCLQPLCCWLQR
jgi:hypothetical protein